MNENNVYVKLTHWTYKVMNGSVFVILWSDHTWTEFRFKWNNREIHNYKNHFELNKLVSKKVPKEEAIKFIERKIKEIES